jgi:hypothetical protein
MGLRDELLKAADKSVRVWSWQNTLRYNGLPMLQIEVRNFLRGASRSERDEMSEFMEHMLIDKLRELDHPFWVKVYKVYKDEDGRLG